MFNIGPLEFVVLAAVALIVFGPDRLPQLAKDGARMLRTLRDLAQGARIQLNEELGPGFSDFDLAKLNPRTAIREALLGDEDFSALNPREVIQRAIRGEDDPVHPPSATGAGASGGPSLVKRPTAAETPLRPGEPAPYDSDAT